MQTAVVIGKYTLESLTTGMYSSPKDLYREYIQNSVDSIDQAISASILSPKEGRIVISIDNVNRRIEIQDNGIGIPAQQAAKVLLDIGNSRKLYSSYRGFRGIGRLAGLSCCDKLTFQSSYNGENKKVDVVFDCLKLRQLLTPGQYNEYDLSSVLTQVVVIKESRETVKKHYFRVILEGVQDIDGILNPVEVKDYLSQVAPVPYDPVNFKWGKEITDKFKLLGFSITEYPIYVEAGEREEQVYKVCKDVFLVDKAKRIYDSIKGVKIHEIKSKEGVVQAYLWYAKTSFFGTILDESMKGIRIRKGNIQIGDRSTLNHVFKEDRFNGWLQGEVFVVDPNIIPNARRDDFEKNISYLNLIYELKKIGDELSKTIRNISSSRNDKSGKILNDAELLINNANNSLVQGFNSNKEKEELADKLSKYTQELEKVRLNDEFNIARRLDIFRQLNILASSVKGATNFKILNLSQKLTIEQKKTLEKVFEVITDLCGKEEADRLIEEIMRRF